MTQARSKRIEEHCKNRDYETAVAECTEAIRLDPADAEAFRVRALVYRYQQNYAPAIADYTAIIRSTDDAFLSAYVFYFRALTYEEQGLYDWAIADYDEVLRINPSFAQAQADRQKAMNAMDGI